ncbi:MAG: LysE/ArgO family amino acid transporter [Propionibacteriaceae bacterium]|jgi:L-lysine exporter family protein LysE/ArgO|nr:LysE/ArgO family amino acid transporter [Propionibacteriaceae bacterium]
MLPLLSGLGAGLTLIVAIGAQNAFVLRQGLRRQHVLALCLLCSGSDALLISLGTLSLGAVVERTPLALDVMRWAGVVFLLGYAGLALRRALRPTALASDGRSGSLSLGKVLAQGAAFTFLNPHVYLDTMLLLGSLANSHGPTSRWAFVAGATVGSVLWFFGLGYGARLLGPLFARPQAWRWLDIVVAAVMIALAVSLTVSSVKG